jgi:leader peptidase (prepilin peptidase)/N-methyltransferase
MSVAEPVSMIVGNAAWTAVLVAMARRRFPDDEPAAVDQSARTASLRRGRRRVVEGLIVGLAAPALGLAAWAEFTSVWIGAFVAAFLSLCVVLSVLDLRWKVIPNALVYPAFLLFLAALVALWAADQGVRLASAAVGVAAYGGGLFILALVWPGAMGMGDVKLAALTGLVLGGLGLRYVSVAAVAAIVVGGLAAILLVLTGTSRKARIPFGPYLAAGAIVAAFWTNPIVDWYLRRSG